MSYQGPEEWPLGNAAREAANAEPPLPVEIEQLLAVIMAGGAIDAFARKRAAQILTHGHTPEHDLTKPVGQLACEAKARLDAFTEIAGGRYGRMNLPADHRERCLRYVEISAGILIALWERCQVEVPEE